MADGYSKRKSNTRTVYRTFVIVCEGQKTERIYFNRYRQRNSGLCIRTPNSKVTDPMGLVKFALSQIPKYGLDLSDGDMIWCVFDVDNNTNENIEKAKALAKNENIELCLSNPCFELWYLLHFCYFSTYIATNDLQSKLKAHIANYDKTKDYFDILLSKRDAAIRHSKTLKQKHDAEGIDLLRFHSNPSTQVFQLVEYILKIIRQNKA